jgi:hypothetical protein
MIGTTVNMMQGGQMEEEDDMEDAVITKTQHIPKRMKIADNGGEEDCEIIDLK